MFYSLLDGPQSKYPPIFRVFGFLGFEVWFRLLSGGFSLKIELRKIDDSFDEPPDCEP